MNKNLNQWIGEGNLSCDPIVRYTDSSKTPVTNFHLYVDSIPKTDKTEHTNTKKTSTSKRKAAKIPIVAWAKKAEMVSKYYKKGDKVRVIGEIRTLVFQKEGVFFNTFEIVLSEISLMSRKDAPSN